MITIFVIVGMLIVSLALPVTRKITRPLRQIADGVKRMAGGDLSVRVVYEDTADEVGALAKDVHKMASSLSSVIGGIIESSRERLLYGRGRKIRAGEDRRGGAGAGGYVLRRSPLPRRR